MKNFRTTGNILDKHPGPKRSLTTPHFVERVREVIVRSPGWSARYHARENLYDISTNQ